LQKKKGVPLDSLPLGRIYFPILKTEHPHSIKLPDENSALASIYSEIYPLGKEGKSESWSKNFDSPGKFTWVNYYLLETFEAKYAELSYMSNLDKHKVNSVTFNFLNSVVGVDTGGTDVERGPVKMENGLVEFYISPKEHDLFQPVDVEFSLFSINCARLM
jgi:hypothetical protein